mgnify:CR=1 FL=1
MLPKMPARAAVLLLLGLPAAGVGLTKEGRVSINDHLQTENPNVYAVGDCCMSTQFTHVAVSSAPVATL